VARFKSAIDSVISAFELLGIGADHLDPGECELGILIPRDAVDGSFAEFANELVDLSFVFGAFSELASGTRDTFAVRTVSSSDLMIFLAATPPVAACVAHAAERVVTLYKKLLEIKKLRAELAQQGVDDDDLSGVNNYANTLMSSGIDELTVEIVADFNSGQDDGRKNELTNAVRISLNKLANKIDRGFNIEVRAEPPRESEGEPSADWRPSASTVPSSVSR